MSDSNKVVKARDIKLTDLPVIAGIRHVPANKADFNACENNTNSGFEIEESEQSIGKKIKIAAKEAYDRGFSKGVTEGINREKGELSLAAESVAKLIGELKVLKKEFLKDSEKEIIDFVFLIARSVIHKEVSTGSEVLLSVLSDAMKNVQERDGISICLNPEDCRYITEAKPDFLNSFGDILIEKDEEIGRGGVVIKTRFGTLDARLDQQLNKIRESLG
ncbi:MAG: hypothetical protein JRD93_05005 [Deltaproteobacteria bacterium]|nr:hypothetical protein [Deltaproteobacteria bacterium]MBW2661343.1 hypothetical protein [Deltaproteobacteria bacterium]